MKATYSGFITDNKNCSGFEFNTDANRIFDFLNQDEIIIKMAEYADQGKPALAGCVLELEQFYEEMDNPMIDFSDGFTRTVVGRMIKNVCPIRTARFTRNNRIMEGHTPTFHNTS